MKKLYLFMMVTLDGYFEGPGHDISWHNTDQEFGHFVVEQTDNIGTILFGKTTYEMMASFWPSEQGQAEPETAKQMKDTPKIVFSTTLEKADWNNTTLKKKVDPAEINALKEASEKDLAVFGSSDLCVSLLEMGLLDEVRLMVNPIILGEGKLLFQGIKTKVPLKLIQKRDFANGNILLTYHVEK